MSGLLSRVLNKEAQILQEILKSSIAMLAGLELAGALKAQIQTQVPGGFSAGATIERESPLSVMVPIIGTANPGTLGDQLDQRLVFPLKTMAYAAAGGWVLGNWLIPRLQRQCRIKEETFMHELLHPENPGAPLVEQASAGRWMENLNALFNLFLPVVLDGAAYSLLFQAFETSKGTFEMVSQNQQIWALSWQNLVIDMTAGIYGLLFSITSGEIPVPKEMLDAFLAVSVLSASRS